MANFFDFQEKLQPPRRPAARDGASAAADAAASVYTVTQLTAVIDKALKAGLPPRVVVQGEVSNCKLHGSSGHTYLTLKDASNCIDCVMFRSEAARMKFRPTDGMELLATGRVGVYGSRGRYQLYLSHLQPLGQGALELAFQQMRAKLEAEGLFDVSRKKLLPSYPRRIALVTGKDTAAVQDMLKVLRRFACLKLLIYSVPVQGEGAGEQIAAALRHLNSCGHEVGGVDVILLGRGGGSLEDLWAFNEECVARAMAESAIPIITGIGHEVDVSIADLVADHHAHTPTEAAQVATAQWKMAGDRVDQARIRLNRELRDLLERCRQRLAAVQRHEVFRRPTDRINQLRQVLDEQQRALVSAMSQSLHRRQLEVRELASRLEQCPPAVVLLKQRQRLAECEQRLNTALAGAIKGRQERLGQLSARLIDRHPRHALELNAQGLGMLTQKLGMALRQRQQQWLLRLAALEGQLRALDPHQVLRRGYSITRRKKNGEIVRSAEALKAGDKLLTRFADGEVESTVEDSRQMRLFE